MFWEGFFIGLFCVPAILFVAVCVFGLVNKGEIEARVRYEERRDG